MGEREGTREPRVKRRRIRAGITAGAVLAAGVIASRQLPEETGGEAYYSRSVTHSTLASLPVVNEIPIFNAVPQPVSEQLPTPIYSPSPPSFDAQLPEIRKNTNYRDINATVERVDLRPDLTVIVVRKTNGNLASFIFWDENVTNTQENNNIEIQNWASRFLPGQKITARVAHEYVSQKYQNEFIESERKQGIDKDSAKLYLGSLLVGNKAALEAADDLTQLEDEYYNIQSKDFKKALRK